MGFAPRSARHRWLLPLSRRGGITQHCCLFFSTRSNPTPQSTVFQLNKLKKAQAFSFGGNGGIRSAVCPSQMALAAFTPGWDNAALLPFLFHPFESHSSVYSFSVKQIKKSTGLFFWRKRWDSNPRASSLTTAFRVRLGATSSIRFHIFLRFSLI